MRPTAAVLAACLAAALLQATTTAAAAAQTPSPASPSSPPAPQRLALLFSADVGSACAGRCRLRATAARCGDGGGGASGGTTTSGGADGDSWARNATAAGTQLLPLYPAAASALEAGWNSLTLPDAAQAEHLVATMEVDCAADPACSPSPPSFVAWRGKGCGDAAADEDQPVVLEAQPFASGAATAATGAALQHRVFCLTGAGGRAAVAVSFAAQAGCGSDVAGQTGAQGIAGEQAAASGEGSMREPASTAGDEGPPPLCAAGRPLLLGARLALAAWGLGCAGLAAWL